MKRTKIFHWVVQKKGWKLACGSKGKNLPATGIGQHATCKNCRRVLIAKVAKVMKRTGRLRENAESVIFYGKVDAKTYGRI